MIYAVYGFVFGLLIPYISRRFAKFMPATMAYALVSLCKFSKKVTSEKWEKSLTYTKLRREFFYRSLLCGIVTAAVSYFAYAHFGSRGLWWQLYFIWSLLLLAEIDYRMFLLPDILTVPLLILGFSASCWGWGHISGAESALGAVGGYFCRFWSVCCLSGKTRMPSAAATSSFWRHLVPGWVLKNCCM